MASSVLEGTCQICDHKLRGGEEVAIHEKLRPMFHDIARAEVFHCGSCLFTYAVIRDVDRPEIEPVVLCGTRDHGSIEGRIDWVSDLGLQGKFS